MGCSNVAHSNHSINNYLTEKCPRDPILGFKTEHLGGIIEICPNLLFADRPVWELESESKGNECIMKIHSRILKTLSNN